MHLSGFYKGYKQYLQLERNLSQNTIEAYLRDISMLERYCSEMDIIQVSIEPEPEFFHNFIKWIVQSGKSSSTHARILSGIRSFYDYLVLEKHIQKNPTELIDFPKLSRKLPYILTVNEINEMVIQSNLLEKGKVSRNTVILELLFACGIRVSELVNLEIGNIYFKEECILVTGKGNKQRLVPISDSALTLISKYLEEIRNTAKVKIADKDILFLNRSGGRLSRIYIFKMVKNLAEKAGINKTISPHTFRHSFATELVTNGADLRSVQVMLGHESITTTEIYAHLDKSELKKVVDEFHPRTIKRMKSK